MWNCYFVKHFKCYIFYQILHSSYIVDINFKSILTVYFTLFLLFKYQCFTIKFKCKVSKVFEHLQSVRWNTIYPYKGHIHLFQYNDYIVILYGYLCFTGMIKMVRNRNKTKWRKFWSHQNCVWLKFAWSHSEVFIILWNCL